MTIIKLPGKGTAVNLNNPEQNLKELVEENFKIYTEGTIVTRNYIDKLKYIDDLRGSMYPKDYGQEVVKLVGESVYQRLCDGDYDFNLLDVIFGDEIIENAYLQGFKPLYHEGFRNGSGNELETLSLIIKYVMNYEYKVGTEK